MRFFRSFNGKVLDDGRNPVFQFHVREAYLILQ